MSKQMTNIWTYVIILFIAVFFISAIQTVVYELRYNSNLDMSDEDKEFTNTIIGINLSNYSDKNSSTLENIDINDINNDTGSTTKDTALEFFYSRSLAGKIKLTIGGIFTLPGFFLKLMRIPENNSLKIFISFINWLWSIGLLIAIYYLVKGVNS